MRSRQRRQPWWLLAALGGVVALAACSSNSSLASDPASRPARAAGQSTATAAATVTVPHAALTTPHTATGTDPDIGTGTANESGHAALACVQRLPVATRVGQVVWPAVYGDELVARRADVRRWMVGGVVLMSWTKQSSAKDLRALKASLRIPLLVATDEEGGGVQRLKSFGVLPSARSMASSHSPAEAREMIAKHAKVVHDLGIDIAYAPVVDVSPRTGTGPIGKRAFSADPKVVAEYGIAYVQGWADGGVLAVAKHFPGHGAASGDTHITAATTAPLDQLRRRDLLPYAALAEMGTERPAVMIGHLNVPGLTEDDLPADLSPAAYRLLRDEYGFADSLVFTDALGMEAITSRFTIPQAVVRAIAAGADVAIYTNTDQTDQVLAALVAAVSDGTLPESRLDDAVARVLRTKHVDPCTITAG